MKKINLQLITMRSIRHFISTLFTAAFMCCLYFIAEGQSFVHPGLLNNLEELRFIRQKVTAGEEPWVSAYQTLLNYPGGFIRSGDMRVLSSLDYKPDPYEYIVTNRGSGARSATNSKEMIQLGRDMMAAYSHALQWYIEQDRAPEKAKLHAKKSIEILDAWSSTLVSWTGTSLFRAGSGPMLGIQAAEIIRYTYNGWHPEKIARFERWLEDVFWPVIGEGYEKHQNASKNNQEAWTVAGRIAIGIFLSDQEKLDHGIAAWRTLLPKNIAADGFNYETCRDLSHAQFSLVGLAVGAEMAWKQGIDLYGELNNRLLKGVEYHIPWILHEPGLPDDKAICKETANSNNNGRIIVRDPKPFYDLIYNHYHNRRGLPAEATLRMISSETAYPADAPRRSYRPEFLVGSYGGHTLTHAKLPPYPAGCQPTMLDTIIVGKDLYTVKWLLKEPFNEKTWSHHWVVEQSEGKVKALDGKLFVEDSKGATIWHISEFPADIVVRYKVRADAKRNGNKNNFNHISHARENDNSELVISNGSGRSGAYKQYHKFANYIATFTFDHTRIRKNPGFNLLANKPEKAEADKDYEITYIVANGRIRYYINGVKVHDVTVKERLPGGKFGIRTWNTTACWKDMEIGEFVSVTDNAQNQ